MCTPTLVESEQLQENVTGGQGNIWSGYDINDNNDEWEIFSMNNRVIESASVFFSMLPRNRILIES